MFTKHKEEKMMKKIGGAMMIAVMLAAMFLFTACAPKVETRSYFQRPVVEKPASGRQVWEEVTNFSCYYGRAGEENVNLNAMKQFDVSIMMPGSMSAEEIASLKEYTWVIGYLTIGEDDRYRVGDGLGPTGMASYYIYDEQGTAQKNPNWGSWYVDAGNACWQAMTLERARAIFDKGCDGLFLDTLDTVDLYGDTLDGMASLVRRLKEEFPDKKIVCNRGFSVLDKVWGFIDGVMFEGFTTTYNFKTLQYDVMTLQQRTGAIQTAVQLNTLRMKKYWPVFALDYYDSESALWNSVVQSCYDRAWEYDFAPYVATINLDKIFPAQVDTVPATVRGIYAVQAEEVDDPTPPDGVITQDNLVYTGNGGLTVKVDSTYVGYSFKRLNDGYVNPAGWTQDDWQKRGWASARSTKEHFIEFAFTQPKTASELIVYWCLDNDSYMSSTAVKVQAFVDGSWVDLASATEIERGTEKTVLTFTATTATQFRVLQPSLMGPATDKQIMWVSEVEMFNR